MFLCSFSIANPARKALWHFVQRAIALVLAWNYFSFQVELFEWEYQANHLQPAGTLAIGAPWLNWESFDKSNAPKAFVFDPQLRIELLFVSSLPLIAVFLPEKPYEPVRDKSPPLLAVS